MNLDVVANVFLYAQMIVSAYQLQKLSQVSFYTPSSV